MSDTSTGLVRPDSASRPSRPAYQSRARDRDRPTRRPLELWDRVKIVLLFVLAWVVMLWAASPWRPMS